MRKKRKRRSIASRVAFYMIEIIGWDWSYSFSINTDRFSDRQFDDYRHLEVNGKLLLPSRIQVKTVELYILPDVEPQGMKTGQPPPRAVGSLYIRENKLFGNLSMAADALDTVVQMLLSGRLKYIVLDGEPMRYRKALIRHYVIKADANVKDYPDD